jgi:flagellar hook-associated protein 1
MAGIGNLLSLARDALNAQAFGLNVTGQNVANANTPGYVRRDAVLETRIAGTITYGGVNPAGIHRSVDSFLDARNYVAGSFEEGAKSRDQALGAIENLFNDTAGTGLSSSLSALFSSFSALGASPNDPTTRAVVLQRADDFAGRLRETSNQIATFRTDLLTQSQGTAAQINEVAGQIAKLNGQITLTENTGGDAADLKDQRDKLVTQLSEKINVHVITDGSGKLVIAAGGATLVEGDRAASLSVGTHTDGSLQIILQRPGGTNLDITAQITGGSLGGIREARDDDAVAMSQKLDQFAYDLATAVNTQHAAGYGTDGVNGRNLFAIGGVSGAAATIALDPAMIGHPERLGAASSAVSLPAGADNAILLAGLLDRPVASGNTRTPAEAYSDLVGEIGQRKAAAAQDVEVRAAMHDQSKAMRESVSGVSMDEELVALSRYQRAYEAASKLLRTADELLAGLMETI